MSDSTAPAWMKHVLVVAGIYNILFGALAVLLPSYFFTPSQFPGTNRL